MSKKKQRLWLLWIMLLYVGIAIVGFFIVYFIKNTLHPTKQSSAPLITPAVAKLPLISPPVGWQTYTNKDDKLVLSYPPNEIIKTSSYGLGITSVDMQNHDNTDSKSAPDFQILLLPKTLAQAAGQDFDKYYAMPDKTTNSITSPLAKDATKENFTKIHNRTLQNLRAFDYESLSSNAKPDEEAEIGVFIEAGNNIVLISTRKSNKKALEQMMSTFKYPF